MATTPTVVVFQSTGVLGGSVVKALLADKGFQVVGVTRDPEQLKAKELASQGVQVVKADFADAQSVQEACSGADAVVAVTNPRSAAGKEAEVGKMLADAAIKAGIKHFIWTTLPDTNAESGGKWPCSLFSEKAKVDAYVATLGFEHHTFISPAGFFSNFQAPLNYAAKGKDGVYTFTLPLSATDYYTGFDEAEDYGKPIPGILKNPHKWGKGQRINYAGTHATYQEYVDTFKRVTGKDARLVEVSLEEVAEKFGGFFGKQLSEMWGWMQEYTYYGKDNRTTAAQLAPHLTTFEEYLKKTADLWT